MNGSDVERWITELGQRAGSNDSRVLDEALALSRQHPQHPACWLLLARLLRQRGRVDAMRDALSRAFALLPHDAELALELAVLQFGAGDRGSAGLTLDRALSHNAQHVGLLFHRGYLYELARDDIAAERCYRAVLSVDADEARSLANLGALLNRAQRYRETRDLLQPHVQRRVDLFAAVLAASHSGLDEHEAALHCAELAAAAHPTSAEAWFTAGLAARSVGDVERATSHLQRACSLAGSLGEDRRAQLESELATALADAGEYKAAMQRLGGLVKQRPRDIALRWRAAMTLPSPAMDCDQVIDARDRFDAGLGELEALLADADGNELRAGYEAACCFLPFPLAYLPFETTALLRRYGHLVHRLAAARNPRLAAPVPWRALAHGGPARIGFVSANLRTHTLMRYFRHWITGLDRQRYTSHLWHLGAITDTETAQIVAAADHFQVHRGDPEAVAASIREARLDVLVFIDIGMDASLSMLAAMRSAPVQCAAYGHPLTTGLPSIDVFLSGADLERDDAAQRYTERLVRLPGIGVEPTRPPPANLVAAAPRQHRRAQVLCTQMPIKLQPEFDEIAAALLAASDAELLLFTGGSVLVQQRVLGRLGSALRRHGLEPSRHLRVLPRGSHADYLGVLAGADLVIDSPWFTGGATSMDAFHVGTPVATIDGVALRARQTAAMARRVGAADLVGRDADNCVGLAVAALANADQRACLRRRTLAGAPLLFNDQRPIDALNELLQQLAQSAHDDHVG